MAQNPIFHDYAFGAQERKQLNHDGHFVLPSLLTAEAQARLTESLARIESLIPGCKKGYEPNRFAAEYDSYFDCGVPRTVPLR